MESKSQKIRQALAAGDHIGALRIAGNFHDRSLDTLAYKRGLDAYVHPGFYRQIDKDPEKITAAAIALLTKNFSPD